MTFLPHYFSWQVRVYFCHHHEAFHHHFNFFFVVESVKIQSALSRFWWTSRRGLKVFSFSSPSLFFIDTPMFWPICPRHTIATWPKTSLRSKWPCNYPLGGLQNVLSVMLIMAPKGLVSFYFPLFYFSLPQTDGWCKKWKLYKKKYIE